MYKSKVMNQQKKVVQGRDFNFISYIFYIVIPSRNIKWKYKYIFGSRLIAYTLSYGNMWLSFSLATGVFQ